jgi:hypothetical protein
MCTTDVVDTGGKWKKIFSKVFNNLFGHLWVFATGVVDTVSKFSAGIPAANLPPVLLIPVAICHR